MPTYQYACTACGEQHEAVQTFTDAPLTDCPACGGRLRKVFSAVGVVFKGSGFYKNDSRSANRSGGDKGSGEGAKTDGGKSDSGKGDGGKGDGAKTDAPKADAPKAGAKGDAAPAAKPSSTPATKSA